MTSDNRFKMLSFYLNFISHIRNQDKTCWCCAKYSAKKLNDALKITKDAIFNTVVCRIMMSPPQIYIYTRRESSPNSSQLIFTSFQSNQNCTGSIIIFVWHDTYKIEHFSAQIYTFDRTNRTLFTILLLKNCVGNCCGSYIRL